MSNAYLWPVDFPTVSNFLRRSCWGLLLSILCPEKPRRPGVAIPADEHPSSYELELSSRPRLQPTQPRLILTAVQHWRRRQLKCQCRGPTLLADAKCKQPRLHPNTTEERELCSTAALQLCKA